MTLYQFNALNQQEQASVLWEDGVMLTAITNKDYRLLLYQIDAFYVEVWFHKKRNKIVRYMSFIGTDKLTPYLNQIDVSEVME
ncbi:MAG TPA: hypothetical protein VF622_17050 [Segetibacter sp.]|jgi:hypothetical protein